MTGCVISPKTDSTGSWTVLAGTTVAEECPHEVQTAAREGDDGLLGGLLLSPLAVRRTPVRRAGAGQRLGPTCSVRPLPAPPQCRPPPSMPLPASGALRASVRRASAVAADGPGSAPCPGGGARTTACRLRPATAAAAACGGGGAAARERHEPMTNAADHVVWISVSRSEREERVEQRTGPRPAGRRKKKKMSRGDCATQEQGNRPPARDGLGEGSPPARAGHTRLRAPDDRRRRGADAATEPRPPAPAVWPLMSAPWRRIHTPPNRRNDQLPGLVHDPPDRAGPVLG